MGARRNDKNKPSGSGTKAKTTWPFYEIMKFLDPCLESRSTSGNVTFEIADVFYADHAGNMHDMMQESMLEGSTPEVLWTPENSQNDKELETPENDVDREYLEELKKINSSRVNYMDPDWIFLFRKFYDGPAIPKWNDSEKRSFNGSWGKQPFGEKKSEHNFSSRKNFDKSKSRQVIEYKLSKLVKTSISVDGKLIQALVDSGTEITGIKKDIVPGISVEGASTIYLKGIFGPAVKCPLAYVPIGLATGGQVNVVH
ncbi:uncharacterized protein TNCV_1233581 [Trichonephila clavipes]|nr:uncharacterized protein TNCV_1233581 [Trichonephila clavipes]